MSLDLDRSTWKRFRLGDVIRRSREQVDPIESGVDRYVGGGHIDGESIAIDRWGNPSDGQMGSTFRYVFEPGQILFVSARPYLRKFGVVNFSGVVADKTYVLDAIPENGLLQEFLPFVLASEPFIAYASVEASGSMNPRLLWGPFQRYELDLPPLDEQRRIADLLWAIERHYQTLAANCGSLERARDLSTTCAFAKIRTHRRLGDGVAASAYGPRFSNSLYADDADYRLLRTTDMDGEGNIDYTSMPSAALDAAYDPHLLQDGDFLISRSGTCGTPAVYDSRRGGPKVIPGAFLIRLRLNDNLDPHYLRALFNSAPGREITDRLAQGGVQKNIRGSSLLESVVPFPSRVRQRELLDQLVIHEVAISYVAAETSKVLCLRNTLLAEIFGGA